MMIESTFDEHVNSHNCVFFERYSAVSLTACFVIECPFLKSLIINNLL
jgi:hypothetical protein